MAHIGEVVNAHRFQLLFHLHFHHSFATFGVATGAADYFVDVAVFPVGQAGLSGEVLLEAYQMVESYIDALLHLLPM